MIIARDIGPNWRIYQRLEWSALQPRALITGALDQYRFGKFCNPHDICVKRLESMRIHGLISGIAGFKRSGFRRNGINFGEGKAARYARQQTSGGKERSRFY